MAETPELRSRGPSWPQAGELPCGFLSPTEPQFPCLICCSNKLPLCGHQDAGEEQCVVEPPSPSTAVLAQRTGAFECTPRGHGKLEVVSCCGKGLGTQGQSLRVWGPGDGDCGFGSWWPLSMAVAVRQVMCITEPCLEKHSCHRPSLSQAVGPWFLCPQRTVGRLFSS